MEAVLAFGAGILFSWWFPAIVFIMALFSEAVESPGWAMFLFLTAFVSLIGIFGVTSWSATTLFLSIFGYFVIGGLHSVWRWYRYTDKVTEEFNAAFSSGHHNFTKSEFLAKTDFRNKVDTITYWAVAWPMSALAYVVADTLDLVRKAIVKWFADLFDSITERARAKVDFENFDRK